MKQIVFILFFISSAAFASNVVNDKYVANEVLVTYKNSTARLNGVSALRKQGFDPKLIFKTNVVKLQVESSVDDAIKKLSQDKNVLAVQPNYIYHILNTAPDDANYGQIWSLKNTGQTITDGTYHTNNPGTNGDDLEMEKVWDVITDCSSVVVAVIDTGVNYDHNDLKDNMWNSPTNTHGYDFIDNDDYPMDLNGHGTHVSGTIAAEGNNSIDAVGICWKARIMGIRVMDAAGSGTTAGIISGINYAATNGAKVINMSLGDYTYDPLFKSAVDTAQASGVLLVAAAGNDDVSVEVTPTYPCAYNSDNILCVAAVDQNFDRANFSNFGAVSVDVAAPGTNILSTVNGLEVSVALNSGWTNSGDWGYTSVSGGDILANPSTWNGTNTYASNAADISYRNLGDMTGANIVVASLYSAVDLEEGNDFLNINYKPGIGNPFVGGTQLASISYKETSTTDIGHNYAYELTNCANQPVCSLGCKLVSNASVEYTGLAVAELSYTKIGPTYSDGLGISNGTSMATPAVAGLATLLFAYNPNFTYADVKNAIMNGGRVCSTVTVSNKVINGWGSLTYINQPTGVTVTQLY